MSPPSIILKIVTEADSTQIERLYREAGWWCDDYDSAFIPFVVKHSSFFVVAIDPATETIIGMGRAISDTSSDAYIQDVTVLPSHRGQGIGSAIIRRLTKSLNESGHDWIGLIGEPGTLAFYQKLGFSPLENHIPMVYTGPSSP